MPRRKASRTVRPELCIGNNTENIGCCRWRTNKHTPVGDGSCLESPRGGKTKHRCIGSRRREIIVTALSGCLRSWISTPRNRPWKCNHKTMVDGKPSIASLPAKNYTRSWNLVQIMKPDSGYEARCIWVQVKNDYRLRESVIIGVK